MLQKMNTSQEDSSQINVVPLVLVVVDVLADGGVVGPGGEVLEGGRDQERRVRHQVGSHPHVPVLH